MDIAMIGLGRMGMNMARRLIQSGHRVVAYNRSPEKTDQLVQEGAAGAYSLPEIREKLVPPRAVWLMLPAGPPVDDAIHSFTHLLCAGDVVIDGGNSYYRDDLPRAERLAGKGIGFLDVGVSGGIWGLEKGYCLMIGGSQEAYLSLEPVFRSLAPAEGYLHCGPVGAGHFVKMIHNGIEYGMMEAYGEGFHILEASPYGKALDYAKVARLWNQGSVIRSWLLELAGDAFSKDAKLSEIRGDVEDSGEGRWTVQQAVETGVSAPVIALSLMRRFQSREKDTFADKVVAALRREFGGHSVVRADSRE